MTDKPLRASEGAAGRFSASAPLAEGCLGADGAAGPLNHTRGIPAFPATRLIRLPLLPGPVVAVWDDDRGLWRAGGLWLRTEELGADAEPMVPAGPLLALATGMDAMAGGADERSGSARRDPVMRAVWAGKAVAREQCAAELREVLASLGVEVQR